GFTGTNCTENGDGIRLTHAPGSPDHTSRELELRRNRLERIGMNGIDVFGRSIVLENNVIDEPCVSKGDCGAVRVFGRENLASSPARDVTLRSNIVRDVLGNTDGCRDDFDPPLGLGLYIDHFAANVTVEGNTVVGSSAVGLLFQRSTGSATDNVLYDNSDRAPWGAQVRLVGGETSVASFGSNALFSLGPERWTLSLEQLSQLGDSDHNAFPSPWRNPHVRLESMGGNGLDLAAWQAASGKDAASSEHWYSLDPADPPRSTILVNDTAVSTLLDPGPGAWLDLHQQPVPTPVTVPAFGSVVLVRNETAIFADGFESGNTSAWALP
ncbi:MAG: right-handed parallel beta-helix repeat-containing protein, partial [Holophagales bacterium]|nr:right-handed parallel beta-helix repeat-containing protein [Holophagales bacterium]